MITQETLVIQVGGFQGLLSRTVATVPIAYAGAQARAQERGRAQWRLSRQCAAVTVFQWFLRWAYCPDTTFIPITIYTTVCFVCPNYSQQGILA